MPRQRLAKCLKLLAQLLSESNGFSNTRFLFASDDIACYEQQPGAEMRQVKRDENWRLLSVFKGEKL